MSYDNSRSSGELRGSVPGHPQHDRGVGTIVLDTDILTNELRRFRYVNLGVGRAASRRRNRVDGSSSGQEARYPETSSQVQAQCLVSSLRSSVRDADTRLAVLPASRGVGPFEFCSNAVRRGSAPAQYDPAKILRVFARSAPESKVPRCVRGSKFGVTYPLVLQSPDSVTARPSWVFPSLLGQRRGPAACEIVRRRAASHLFARSKILGVFVGARASMPTVGDIFSDQPRQEVSAKLTNVLLTSFVAFLPYDPFARHVHATATSLPHLANTTLNDSSSDNTDYTRARPEPPGPPHAQLGQGTGATQQIPSRAFAAKRDMATVGLPAVLDIIRCRTLGWPMQLS
ncbi:hypothetical protein BKA93DRAFT_824952 [Sparassis latifolia]